MSPKTQELLAGAFVGFVLVWLWWYLAAGVLADEHPWLCAEDGAEGVITADGGCLTAVEYVTRFAPVAVGNPLAQITVMETVGERLYGLNFDEITEVWERHRPVGPERWRGLIERYFPPERVEQAMRIMACESNGNPDALHPRSHAGGLFQFLPSTWRAEAATSNLPTHAANRFNPELNVRLASEVVQRDGSWRQWVCK